MAIKNNYIVEKSNILNEIRDVNMSLQELRFFSIYLAKINARDISTRRVCFPLSDFQKIMNIGRMNINHFKKTVNGLLCKVIHIPNDRSGLSSFQLFKEVELYKDDDEIWTVEIDAHDKALPLLFNLKKNYFTYELWNALRLKSINQLRMYELLKQHEKKASLEIKVSELRNYLNIPESNYKRLVDFKNRVLDSCREAIKENTDICYTYTPGETGRGGKWLTIIFHIYKNTEYKNPLNLDEFIKTQPTPEKLPEQQTKIEIPIPPQPKEKHQLSGNLEKDLTQEEISLLCDLLSYKVQKESERTQDKLIERLRIMYSVSMASSSEPIRNAFAYLKKTVININPDNLPALSSRKKENFDIEKYKIFVNDF